MSLQSPFCFRPSLATFEDRLNLSPAILAPGTFEPTPAQSKPLPVLLVIANRDYLAAEASLTTPSHPAEYPLPTPVRLLDSRPAASGDYGQFRQRFGTSIPAPSDGNPGFVAAGRTGANGEITGDVPVSEIRKATLYIRKMGGGYEFDNVNPADDFVLMGAEVPQTAAGKARAHGTVTIVKEWDAGTP